MAFQFTLETVLRLRENLEHTESLLLERRYAELARVQGMLWEAEQNIVYAREQKDQELTRGMTAVQLQLAVEEESCLRQHRDALIKKLHQTQALLREQIAAYRKARQGRDILQELRKQKFDLYRREQEKTEQRLSDETFLLRRRSKR